MYEGDIYVPVSAYDVYVQAYPNVKFKTYSVLPQDGWY